MPKTSAVLAQQAAGYMLASANAAKRESNASASKASTPKATKPRASKK